MLHLFLVFNYSIHYFHYISYFITWIGFKYYIKNKTKINILNKLERITSNLPIKITNENREQLLFGYIHLIFINIFIFLSKNIFGKYFSLKKYYTNYQNVPQELLEDIENHNIVLLLPHYGLFMDTTISEQTQNRLCCVAGINKPKIICDFFYRNRKESEFIYKKGSFDKIINTKSKIIGIACDQRTINRNNPKITFLNKERYFPYGPANIAKQMKRNIWTIFTHYDFDKKCITQKFVPIFRKEENSSELDPETTMQKTADVFTSEIVKNMDNYLGFLH